MSLRPRAFGFTLVELLVVTAILAVLAAVLFPVFKRVEEASRSAVCISNFHQVGVATLMYTSDYDDRFMPIGTLPNAGAHSANSHSWVQILLAYTSKNFGVFHCPADPTGNEDLTTFDQDLVPGDSYSEFYATSLHVNTGYNYQYLSPVLLEDGQWVSQPKLESDVRDGARTVLFVDSKWSLKDSDVTDGGSWLVVPPCRYAIGANGQKIDTFLAGQQAQAAFVLDAPWSGNTQFGAAWPWHMGRMTVAHVNGSVSSLTPAQLSTGCDTATNMGSRIQDPRVYGWDLN